ncbi:YwmB family TATA-box binding protein [Paenibacillus marinisediminis]
MGEEDVMLQWNKGALSAGLCLIMLACIGGWATVNGTNPAESVYMEKKQEDLSEHVNMLRVLADLTKGSRLHTQVMLQGNFPADEEAWKSERERWYEAAAIHVPLQTVQERGREVYRASYRMLGLTADVLLFHERTGLGYYVITVKGQEEGGLRQAAGEVERLESALYDAGYVSSWNATVQTEVDADRLEAWKRVEAAVKEWGQAVPLDRYEDARTISVSFDTDYMGDGVMLSGKRANLQVAVHENTDLHKTRISFGTPLIAGEY